MQKNVLIKILLLFFIFNSSLALSGVEGFINYCNAQEKELNLRDVWASGKFFARSIYGVNSMNDGKFYTSQERNSDSKVNEIIKYSFESGEAIETILKSEWLTPKDSSEAINFSSYSFSADENKILLSTDVENIYRYSSKENNFVFDRSTKSLKALSPNGKQAFATFSPDGKKVAFMRENNLFVVDLASGKESQITMDGEFNKIINGGTDWVNEEEFAFTKAFFWSPDNEKIVYYRFDESEVEEYTMPLYDGLYPTLYKFKYPKTGEKNAVISLFTYDLKTNKTIPIKIGDDQEQYIPRVGWTKDANTIWLQRMNRHQNKLELMYADAETGDTRVVLTETNQYYIDITDDLTFLEDGKHFVWSSEKSGFNHLYLYDIEGNEINKITQGEWDVTSFYGVDESKNLVYYASAEVSPLERQVYVVGLDGKKKQKLSKKSGSNSGTFSSDFTYFLNFHSDANTPTTVTLHNAKGKQIRVVKENNSIVENMEAYNFSKKEFFDFSTQDGVKLNGYMIKPPNFDPNKKYPVLMWVYGGPGSQQVRDSWGGSNFIWYQYLASKGYLVACVDNRGTGARGENFKKMTYLQLGKYETIDQIEAAKHLGKLAYVDESRIGIMGWSYGGYMSSLCITKGADVFKTAVAVAPVTNWRFYDTIYTERYMRTPQENPDGYDDNSPIYFTDGLKGNYLLIHGTADDNVHYQNSMMMVKEMVKRNKKFDFESYVDKNHGIYGGLTRLQLFTKVSDYLFENL